MRPVPRAESENQSAEGRAARAYTPDVSMKWTFFDTFPGHVDGIDPRTPICRFSGPISTRFIDMSMEYVEKTARFRHVFRTCRCHKPH